MSEVFISYVEEDGGLARQLSSQLRSLGQTTWTYEEDGIAGLSYLTQVFDALSKCSVFVLIASRTSIKSHQVVKEVEQAHELKKLIVPVRLGITHPEFTSADPILRIACGTAVTLFTDGTNPEEIARRIQTTIRTTTQRAAPTVPVIEEPAVPRFREPVHLGAGQSEAVRTVSTLTEQHPAVSALPQAPLAAPGPKTSEPTPQEERANEVTAARVGSLALAGVGVFFQLFAAVVLLNEVGPLLDAPALMTAVVAESLITGAAASSALVWTVMALAAIKRWRPRLRWIRRLLQAAWATAAVVITLSVTVGDSRSDWAAASLWLSVFVAVGGMFIWRGLALRRRTAI